MHKLFCDSSGGGNISIKQTEKWELERNRITKHSRVRRFFSFSFFSFLRQFSTDLKSVDISTFFWHLYAKNKRNIFKLIECTLWVSFFGALKANSQEVKKWHLERYFLKFLKLIILHLLIGEFIRLSKPQSPNIYFTAAVTKLLVPYIYIFTCSSATLEEICPEKTITEYL